MILFFFFLVPKLQNHICVSCVPLRKSICHCNLCHALICVCFVERRFSLPMPFHWGPFPASVCRNHRPSPNLPYLPNSFKNQINYTLFSPVIPESRFIVSTVVTLKFRTVTFWSLPFAHRNFLFLLYIYTYIPVIVSIECFYLH